MTDYSFYTGVYLGSSISEKAFPSLLAGAEAFLDRLKGCCRVEAAGEDSEKMALCAMAEALQRVRSRQGIKSTGVGGVSVSYETGGGLNRALYEAAAVYLDIYRGVG